MSVIRVNKTKNYTVMSNYHFYEKDMSLKAKGLLSFMLTLPEDWDYSINGLVSLCKESKTAIRNTLKELEEFGYLKITKTQNELGQFEYIYDIFEKPEHKKPDTENLDMGDLGMENQLQLNTNKLNTNKLREEKSNNILNNNINKTVLNNIESTNTRERKKSGKEKNVPLAENTYIRTIKSERYNSSGRKVCQAPSYDLEDYEQNDDFYEMLSKRR
jgi:predicted transcriptional regulator